MGVEKQAQFSLRLYNEEIAHEWNHMLPWKHRAALSQCAIFSCTSPRDFFYCFAHLSKFSYIIRTPPWVLFCYPRTPVEFLLLCAPRGFYFVIWVPPGIFFCYLYTPVDPLLLFVNPLWVSCVHFCSLQTSLVAAHDVILKSSRALQKWYLGPVLYSYVSQWPKSR